MTKRLVQKIIWLYYETVGNDIKWKPQKTNTSRYRYKNIYIEKTSNTEIEFVEYKFFIFKKSYKFMENDEMFDVLNEIIKQLRTNNYVDKLVSKNSFLKHYLRKK